MNMNLGCNKKFLVVSSTGAKAWVKVSSIYPKTLDLDWSRVDGPTFINPGAYFIGTKMMISELAKETLWGQEGTNVAYGAGYFPKWVKGSFSQGWR
jgi:hypothetical protein